MKNVRIDLLHRDVALNCMEHKVYDRTWQRSDDVDDTIIYEGECIIVEYASTYYHFSKIEEKFLFTYPKPQKIKGLFKHLATVKRLS